MQELGGVLSRSLKCLRWGKIDANNGVFLSRCKISLLGPTQCVLPNKKAAEPGAFWQEACWKKGSERQEVAKEWYMDAIWKNFEKQLSSLLVPEKDEDANRDGEQEPRRGQRAEHALKCWDGGQHRRRRAAPPCVLPPLLLPPSPLSQILSQS